MTWAAIGRGWLLAVIGTTLFSCGANEKTAQIPGVDIRTVTIAGAHEPITALLLEPITPSASAPGILFVHWGFGDRTSFEREAGAYAQAGVTSLLIDAPGFGLRKGPVPGGEATVMQLYALGFLDDLVRALDYLSARPGVDPTRLGYVGHSLGAAIAGAFLARDARVRAAVLMTPTGRISQFWVTEGDPNRAQLEMFDGVVNLPTTTVPMLFQFAQEDEWITRADAEAQVAAAAGIKTARWYDTDHALNGEALVERAAWLTTTLSFPRIPVVSTDNLLPNAQVQSYRVSKPFLHLRNWIASHRG